MSKMAGGLHSSLRRTFSPQSVENLPTVFGSNSKAQTAAKTVFDLAHRHGNILREGWKNIMESMLQLFRAELLPKAMVEVSLLHGDVLLPPAGRSTKCQTLCRRWRTSWSRTERFLSRGRKLLQTGTSHLDD